MARTDLRALFDEITDPRVQRTRRHRLTDVLVLVLLGTVVGCPGWDAIERFAYERKRELRDILALPGGIPGADMLRRVMGALEPAALARALTSWTDALCETFAGKQIAIDGKSIRGTLEAAHGESALRIAKALVDTPAAVATEQLSQRAAVLLEVRSQGRSSSQRRPRPSARSSRPARKKTSRRSSSIIAPASFMTWKGSCTMGACSRPGSAA